MFKINLIIEDTNCLNDSYQFEIKNYKIDDDNTILFDNEIFNYRHLLNYTELFEYINQENSNNRLYKLTPIELKVNIIKKFTKYMLSDINIIISNEIIIDNVLDFEKADKLKTILTLHSIKIDEKTLITCYHKETRQPCIYYNGEIISKNLFLGFFNDFIIVSFKKELRRRLDSLEEYLKKN